MNARIERLWRRRPTENGVAHEVIEVVAVSDGHEQSPADAETDATPADPALAASTADGPEQPVLLAPAGVSRQVHVGDVLPPVRRGWPRQLARLPEVPKRAILAAGLCAGLAAPVVTRHLVTRLLAGNGAAGAGAQATMEITRIVFHGPLTAEAISTIQKALMAGRR
jgi:hypothetical protein